jgi:5-methylcytosine-specific restriction endonuclease McrA
MSCLVLNATYQPMRPIGTKRAIRLVLQGKADIVESSSEQTFRSANTEIPTPLVIRLRKTVKVPDRFRQSVTNTFLFARDGYTCQYCGRHDRDLKEREGLTRDHVQPVSRGGGNVWTNVVTACSTCNMKKADRTPEEAGLVLRKVPKEPKFVNLRWQIRKLTPLQLRYVTMFYGDDFLRAVE